MQVIAAPGQGAHAYGFLLSWPEFPGVTERIRIWSELVERDLIRFGTTGATRAESTVQQQSTWVRGQ